LSNVDLIDLNASYSELDRLYLDFELTRVTIQNELKGRQTDEDILIYTLNENLSNL